MHRHPRSGLAHLIVMLVLASGVIIGLLAMHTIVSSSGDHGEQVPAMAAEMAAEMATPGSVDALAIPEAVGMPGTCSGMCDPGHVMASMACVLALLFSGVILFIAASRQRSTFFAATRSLWRAIAPAACLALPPPPDLNALSISRT